MSNVSNKYFIVRNAFMNHQVNNHGDIEFEIFPIDDPKAMLGRVSFLVGGLDSSSKELAGQILDGDLSIFSYEELDVPGGSRPVRFWGRDCVDVYLGKKVG